MRRSGAAAVIAWACLLLPSSVILTPSKAEESYSLTPLEQVQYLLGVGLVDDAKDVLARFLNDSPDDIDGNFIDATIAADEQRWRDAIAIYRKILDRHPYLPRVRLDYARALYEIGDDEESSYNFRLMLAEVPDDVAPSILGFLNAINSRKRCSRRSKCSRRCSMNFWACTAKIGPRMIARIVSQSTSLMSGIPSSLWNSCACTARRS